MVFHSGALLKMAMAFLICLSPFQFLEAVFQELLSVSVLQPMPQYHFPEIQFVHLCYGIHGTSGIADLY